MRTDAWLFTKTNIMCNLFSDAVGAIAGGKREHGDICGRLWGAEAKQGNSIYIAMQAVLLPWERGGAD